MKTSIISHFLFLFIVGSMSAQTNYNMKVAEALNKAEWFELKRILPIAKDSIDPLIYAYAEAMVSHNFCSPDSACTAFDKLLNNYQPQIGDNIIGMTFLKTTQLARKCEYNKAAQTLRNVVEKYNLYNSYFHHITKQYAALDSIGGINKIRATQKDIIIPFELSTIWTRNKPNYAIMLKAKVNGKPTKILFDTGAGVNVISKRMVDELNVQTLDIKTSAHGINKVDGQYAIAGNIELGNMTIENVPFQVFDISSGIDSIDDKYMKHLDMILGVQFMNCVDELHIDMINQCIYIPKTTAKNEVTTNLCGGTHGLYLIEMNINGRCLPVNIDTGAGSSTLLCKYFEKFKEEIERIGEIDTLREAGAGGIRVQKAYKLKHVNASVGNIGYDFPEIHVATSTDERTDSYANIGMDYIINFSKVIFDFKNKHIKVIKRH